MSTTGVRGVVAAAVCCLLLGLTGCSSSPQPLAPGKTASSTGGAGSAHSTTPSSSTTSTPTTTRTAPGAQDAAVTKLLVFVVENHSLTQMRTGMPYTYRLATSYGYASSYFATRHPSLPNYIAIASGSTHGITTNAAPADNVAVRGPSVFGRTRAAGGTARVYADAMPGACATVSSGRYAVKHNPWPYFVDERSLCRRDDVPVTALAADITSGSLPNAGMVVPDLCHDAHDCSLGTADAWFKGWMTRIQAGPDWRAGRLAVVLTADEDDKSSGNRVLTVVAHPSQHGRVVKARLDHYSLTRLYAEVTGTVPLGQGAKAASMAEAFALPLG